MFDTAVKVVNGSQFMINLWINGELPFPNLQTINLKFSWIDIFNSILYFTILAGFRYRLNAKIFTPLAKYLEVREGQEISICEHLFKGIFYTLAWTYEAYLVLYIRPEIYYDKPNLWLSWSMDNNVPMDIYILYVSQSGFYLQEIFAMCMNMEIRRKDNSLMLCHHGVTLVLLFLSLWTRHYIEGLLVLFCHDINDIFLEFWKLNYTLATRGNGQWFAIHNYIATAFFATFLISWGVTRLIFYPQLVFVNSFDTTFRHFDIPDAIPPHVGVFGILLLTLYMMDCYWFSMIIHGTYRTLVNNSKRIHDTREYNIEKD